MKHIFKLLFVIALLPVFTVASAQMKADSASKAPVHIKKAKAKKDADFVFVQNNVLMHHHDGVDEILHQNFLCRDGGSTVTPTLDYIRKDNSVLKLHNGDKVYRNGTIKFGPKEKAPKADSTKRG